MSCNITYTAGSQQSPHRNDLIKTTFLCAVLFASLHVCCQQWYYSPAPNGRDINTVKIFNHDTIITAGGWHIINPSQTEISPAVFKTTISGLGLWNVVNYADPNPNWIRSMDFTDPDNGIAVGWGGKISVTTDGGESWVPGSPSVSRDFNKIFIINSQDMIIAGGEHSDSVAGGMQTILRSINGGQAWSVAHDQPGYWLHSVHFPTGTTGFAVGDSGVILKTANGGATWTPVAAPVQRNFNAIWFTDANHGFIAGGYPSDDSIRTLLQTTNGGNTWTISIDEPGSMLRDIHFADAGTGYAVGDRAIVLKTTDGGASWAPLLIPGTDSAVQFNAVRFHDTSFGFVCGKWGRQYICNTAPPPVAITGGAVINSTQAVLHASVNSHGYSSVYSFLLSFDNLNFGETPYPGFVNSATLAPVQYNFPTLLPNTTYRYLVKSWTLGGTVYGDTLSFYAGGSGTELKTLPASDITDTSVILHGSIRGFPVAMNLVFEYGTSSAFASQAAATPATVNDTALQALSAAVSGLQSNTVYYFRLKGVNGLSSYYSDTLSFFSGGGYFSGIQTLPASNVADLSATLNGLVAGFRIPVTLSFDYSEGSMSFDNSIPADPNLVYDSSERALSAVITSLTPATLCYFRLKAETALETLYGDTLQFYTKFSPDDFVRTLAAAKFTATSGQFNGEIGGFHQAVDLSFEYGATPELGMVAQAAPPAVNDPTTQKVAASVSGLQDNTLYYFRLKAEIASGPVYYGEMKQLYTGYTVIPDWDFQHWEEKTYILPRGWTVMGDDFERVAGHSGNYALKISKSNVAATGILYDNGTDFPGFIRGAPFHARPDSISFFADYYIHPGENAIFLAHLYDSAYNDISTTVEALNGNSGGAFKRLSFPIAYNSGLMPDSLIVGFMSSSPDGSDAGINNYMVIDDIAAVPSSPAVYNGDLEHWFGYSNTVLTDWFYLKHALVDTPAPPPLVTRSFFKAPDDYAAELANMPLGSDSWISSEISNRASIFDKATRNGFPVYERHQSLHGFYKWLPVNGDTMTIEVAMIFNRQIIGTGQFTRADSVTEFSMFEIPISYVLSTVTPDTAIIYARCQGKKPAKGASRLMVDKLSFDGYAGSGQINAIGPQSAERPVVFPNPASSTLTMQLNSEMTGTAIIYNLNGCIIYSKDFTGSSLSIDTREFSGGFYILGIEHEGKRMMSKVMVIR